VCVLAPRFISNGFDLDVKLSLAEEVMGLNLLFPLGVRPAMDIRARILPHLPSIKWGSTQVFPVRYFFRNKIYDCICIEVEEFVGV